MSKLLQKNLPTSETANAFIVARNFLCKSTSSVPYVTAVIYGCNGKKPPLLPADVLLELHPKTSTIGN